MLMLMGNMALNAVAVAFSSSVALNVLVPILTCILFVLVVAFVLATARKKLAELSAFAMVNGFVAVRHVCARAGNHFC